MWVALRLYLARVHDCPASGMGQKSAETEKDVLLTKRTQLSIVDKGLILSAPLKTNWFLMPANPKQTPGPINPPGFGIEPNVSECYNEREKARFGPWAPTS